MEARITKKTKDILVIEWEKQGIGYGNLSMVWNPLKGRFIVDAEMMDIDFIIEVFKSLIIKPKDYCQCDFPLIRNGEYCGDCGKDIESKVDEFCDHYFIPFEIKSKKGLTCVTCGKEIEEYHKKKLLSELAKAKALTEHLSQEERNEYFDMAIKNLK